MLHALFAALKANNHTAKNVDLLILVIEMQED